MSTADTTTETDANTRPRSAEDLPDSAPVPQTGFGPALNEQGVLAAADVFTASTTFHVMQSLRLDVGYGSQVHP
jgi:hypothetical protein